MNSKDKKLDSIIKAKIIIELLDDRKYPILSSFSNDELTKLNNVDLTTLDQLEKTDINNIINEFNSILCVRSWL